MSIGNEDLISIIEIMADVEHERWARWQKYLHSLCTKNEDGSLTISKSRVKHWEKEIKTKYAELLENIKEYDRKEARNTISVLKKHNFEIMKVKF